LEVLGRGCGRPNVIFVLDEMRQASDRPDASIEALIDLLDHDDRPSFILEYCREGSDLESEHTVTYRNLALSNLINDRYNKTQDEVLRQWIGHYEQHDTPGIEPSIDWDLDGLAWRTTRIEQRWKVTYLRHLLAVLAPEHPPTKRPNHSTSDLSPQTLQSVSDTKLAAGPSSPLFIQKSDKKEPTVLTLQTERTRGRKRKRYQPSLSIDPSRDCSSPSSPSRISKHSPGPAEEAERTRNMFKELAEYATVGCAIYHPDGRLVFVNDAYLKLTGISRDMFRHGSWQKVVVPEDLAIVEEQWRQLAAGKTIEPFAFRVKKPFNTDPQKDGSEAMKYRWLLSNARPKLNPDGSCRSVMGWLTDISHQKWSEHLQAKRLEDALENKLQTEKFIDMVSYSR
jgi:PAS domain S-box-containing protein